MSDHEPRQLVFTETREPARRGRSDATAYADHLRAMVEDAIREVNECMRLVERYSVPDGALTIKIVVEQKMKPKEASDG